MELEGPYGGGSAAQTETGTLLDVEGVHDLQPVASIGYSGGPASRSAKSHKGQKLI
jgi:hypothetical protein